MIELAYGDLLQAPAQVLVNPVNCVGAMGKGLALQFRNAYPGLLHEYQEMCDNRWLHPGGIFLYRVPGSKLPRYIACVATKGHWQEPSSQQTIERCVLNLHDMLAKYRFESIAIPALGCGEGRLAWPMVQDLLYNGLKQLENVRIIVYPPHVAQRASAPFVIGRPVANAVLLMSA